MKRERPLRYQWGPSCVWALFTGQKSSGGTQGMGRGEKMAKTPSKTASTLKSRDALKLEFKEKFGHSYDPKGYGGHPFFGSHCYGCGIHISRIIANKGLRGQLELDMGEANRLELVREGGF